MLKYTIGTLTPFFFFFERNFSPNSPPVTFSTENNCNLHKKSKIFLSRAAKSIITDPVAVQRLSFKTKVLLFSTARAVVAQRKLTTRR
jgi:hypothetical protein